MNNNNYEIFIKAKNLIKEKKYDEAQFLLKKINNMEPQDNIIKFELARVLLYNRKTKKEGKAILLKLLNTTSKNYAILELGKLEVLEGNYNKARLYFEQLLNTKDKNFAMVELGKLEVLEGNFDKARLYFEQLLNTKDKNFAILELGKLQVLEGNFNKARLYFEQLLNTHSKTYAILELGKLEVLEGNYNKARLYFEQLLNTTSKNYAMIELGKLEALEGNFDKARLYFEQLLNTKDKNFAMVELGKLEVLEGNYNKARLYFEQLLNEQNKNYAKTELIFLDIKEEKYLSAYNRFKELLPNHFYKNQYDFLKLYLQYKLNIIDKNQLKVNNYCINQLLDYNENYAIEHIRKHLDENNNKITHTIFNENVDIKELFYYAKNQIKNIQPVEITTVHKYILECQKEISNDNNTKYLKIITIPNSDHILTMYPIIYYKKEKNKIKQLKKEEN